MKRILILLLAGIIITLFQSCIKEGVDNGCISGTYLKFRYTDAAPGQYIEVEKLEKMAIYIYNSDGMLFEIPKLEHLQVVDQYTYLLPVNEGAYQLLLWTGTDENFYTMRNIDRAIHRMGESEMRLNRNSENIIAAPPSCLYYSKKNAMIKPSRHPETIVMDIEQVTSDVRVIMNGLEKQEAIDHQITIMDDNGTLCFEDLSILTDDMLTYQPRYETITRAPYSLNSFFTVMRLWQGRHPHLNLYSGDGSLQKQWDLLDELILKYPEADFITGKAYEIEFSFAEGYIPLSIKINGWEILNEEVGQ